MKKFVVYRQGLKNQIMSETFRQKNQLSTLGEGIHQHIKKINPKTNTQTFSSDSNTFVETDGGAPSGTLTQL